jgi:tetratricopeptide (TPR) repeat protein
MIAAERLVEEQRYVEAARIVSRLMEQFETSAPHEARELLKKLRSDPAAAAQLAASEQKLRQEQRESRASAQLDAARKLVTRDLRAGYAAIKKISNDFPETQSGMQAQHEAENLLADPNNRRLLETDPNEEVAGKLLLLAQNYERNKLFKEAAERCERILREYPNTKAAATAKKMLAGLKQQ